MGRGWPSRRYTLCSRTPMDGKNYVGKIWRGMCKVSISTIPVSRREGSGGGGGGGGGGGEEGGGNHAPACEVCLKDTTTSKLE